jgi:hypothetical protein
MLPVMRVFGPCWFLLIALVAAQSPASAQGQLRMPPLPAEAPVAVPPRGAAVASRLVPSPEAWDRIRTQPPPAAPETLSDRASPLAPMAGLLLPLVAGAVLGAGVPGSGTGGAGVAPAVTVAPR